VDGTVSSTDTPGGDEPAVEVAARAITLMIHREAQNDNAKFQQHTLSTTSAPYTLGIMVCPISDVFPVQEPRPERRHR
jgi:hypothetical protein